MKKIGIIFGGESSEHDISVLSAKSVIDNIDKKKYEIYPIYIDKNGDWYEYDEKIHIENIIKYLKNIDVVFPILHGKYGEDGSIQGMFEMFNIPYVGCSVLASCIGMNKAYAKMIFEKAGINQAKYCYIRKFEEKIYFIDNNLNQIELDNLYKKIEDCLKYPMFIKPANSGSSIGISKVKNRSELIVAIDNALQYDDEILIEEEIIGREIECSVLGNEEVRASCVGEIITYDNFYDFSEKYEKNTAILKIPAEVPQEKQIQELAIKAFRAINGSGLSRVDFFLTENGKIYINEINTMPGFTNISMYAKLWERSGIGYRQLIDELIKLAN